MGLLPISLSFPILWKFHSSCNSYTAKTQGPRISYGHIRCLTNVLQAAITDHNYIKCMQLANVRK